MKPGTLPLSERVKVAGLPLVLSVAALQAVALLLEPLPSSTQ